MSKDREKQILEIMLNRKKVSVKELASALFISEPSIRRDLKSLEEQKLVQRTHGGAVIDETALSKHNIPFMIREYEESNAKTLIAKKAIDFVHDGDVIFLDSSTSAYNLIPFLASRSNITVITNGVKSLTALAEIGINTISTGGNLLSTCLSLVGEEAYSTVERIHADAVFFSCRGLSDDGYLTDFSEKDNYVREKMIQNSKNSYLLCTENKIKLIRIQILSGCKMEQQQSRKEPQNHINQDHG